MYSYTVPIEQQTSIYSIRLHTPGNTIITEYRVGVLSNVLIDKTRLNRNTIVFPGS
uniref:Uncharacterized protein n=1 Tax=Anguilla anguilla TaxID=7936 RepID=A0A0E9W1H5_ANGAN